MPFFSKKLKTIRRAIAFPTLPRKFRVMAVGIEPGLQEALLPHLRLHNADVRYIADAMELANEPRMADVLLVCPVEMGINRKLAQRLKKVRIQLRYEAEGENSALHVMQLAVQVSTNPGSYQELKNRVDRFDAKWNDRLGAETAAPSDPNEIMNSDIAAAMNLAQKTREGEASAGSDEAQTAVARAAVAAAEE